MDIAINFSQSAFKHGVNEADIRLAFDNKLFAFIKEKIMPELTEEEYDALDEYYTKNPPKIDPSKNGTGFFSKKKAAYSVTIDSFSANYLFTKAMATQKTPADIIGEMVQKELAAAV